MGANEKYDATFHPNDPEHLNEHMNRIGYRPWISSEATNAATEKELSELGIGEPKEGDTDKPRQEIGRAGKMIVSGVVLAIVLPFVILLWRWAMAVAF